MQKKYWLIPLPFILIISIFFYQPSWLNAIFHYAKLDLVGHYFGFLGLTWLIHQVVKLPLPSLTIGLIFYAAMTELGQKYLGFRNGEFNDFIADSLGIISYVIICYLYQSYQNRKTLKPAELEG